VTQSKYEKVMSAVRLPPDRPETWKQYWRFPLYEVSDKGRHRKIGADAVLSQRLNGRKPPYYWLMDFRGAPGEKTSVSGQVAVLETFLECPCPDGLESLHGDYGQLVNWWPENLKRGTKKQNAAMKPVNGGGEPSFPCRNAPACGNMVMSEGRRCRPCVKRAARIITDMLNAGLSLDEVTDRMGYENPDWVYRLAVELGGCTLTKRDARRQRPTWRQRVAVTLRDKRRNGWGDAA
jgi:hypothetical protein